MKIEIFKGDTDGSDYYWRARARNGRIIADGGEGYSTRGKARRAAHRLVTLIRTTTVVVVSL